MEPSKYQFTLLWSTLAAASNTDKTAAAAVAMCNRHEGDEYPYPQGA